MNIDKLKIYDVNRTPILGFLHCLRPDMFKFLLVLLNDRTGIVVDYFGVEYEENDTLTFFDFTCFDVDIEINVSIQEFLEIIPPIIQDYLDKYPEEEKEIKNILVELAKR